MAMALKYRKYNIRQLRSAIFSQDVTARSIRNLCFLGGECWFRCQAQKSRPKDGPCTAHARSIEVFATGDDVWAGFACPCQNWKWYVKCLTMYDICFFTTFAFSLFRSHKLTPHLRISTLDSHNLLSIQGKHLPIASHFSKRLFYLRTKTVQGRNRPFELLFLFRPGSFVRRFPTHCKAQSIIVMISFLLQR